MAAKTEAYRTDSLNVLRGTNITAPTAIYLSALTALSSDGSSGGTPIDAATRQPITFSTADSSGFVYNTTEILFPVATMDWGNIVGGAVWSSSGTSGYCFLSGDLSSAVNIVTNDQFKISSGGFSYQEI